MDEWTWLITTYHNILEESFQFLVSIFETFTNSYRNLFWELDIWLKRSHISIEVTSHFSISTNYTLYFNEFRWIWNFFRSTESTLIHIMFKNNTVYTFSVKCSILRTFVEILSSLTAIFHGKHKIIRLHTQHKSKWLSSVHWYWIYMWMFLSRSLRKGKYHPCRKWNRQSSWRNHMAIFYFVNVKPYFFIEEIKNINHTHKHKQHAWMNESFL